MFGYDTEIEIFGTLTCRCTLRRWLTHFRSGWSIRCKSVCPEHRRFLVAAIDLVSDPVHAMVRSESERQAPAAKQCLWRRTRSA